MAAPGAGPRGLRPRARDPGRARRLAMAAAPLGTLEPVSRVKTYIEVAPPKVLAPFVECFWVHRVDTPPTSDNRRLLPDGRLNMVWVAEIGTVRVAGPMQRFLMAPALDRMLALGARFWPGAASALLRADASELADSHVLLDAIDPRLTRRIDERLSAAPDVPSGLVAMADELARRLRDVPSPDAGVRAAVRALDLADATVADAAASAHVSERELQRRFVREVGYAPKTLHRVLRFQRFMDQLHLPRVDLAGAAALAGYADQSHLSREARRIAGLSPRQLVDFQH